MLDSRLPWLAGSGGDGDCAGEEQGSQGRAAGDARLHAPPDRLVAL